MIAAFVVLLILALGLGGYIVFTEASKRRKAAYAAEEEAFERARNYIALRSSESDETALEAEHVQTPASSTEGATESDGEADIQTAANDDDESDDDDEVELKAVVENGTTRYIVIKYSKSFLAKLIQSDGETKRYYSFIKNRLLSYDGVKSRVSWKWESFRFGRITLAKLRLRGKTLSLCLALNAEDYADSKYKVESLDGIKAYADTPCMYRIKNDRRLKYGEELIAALMERNGITEKLLEETDYAAKYPYETTEALIGRKLIKELTDEDAQSGTAFKPREILHSVTAQEVDSIMQDEVAATLIEESEGTSDRTKTDIVNIDALSQYFESGERVTLDEIKKRVKGFNKQTTYLKVLARGTLNKALTVEADSFSLQAVKMIVLTGGTAIRKR